MVHGDAIQLTGLAGSSLIGFLLVLSRVGGLFVLAPGFSSRMIPARVKFVMAVAISLASPPRETALRVDIKNVDFRTSPGFNIAAVAVIAILAILYYVWW